MVGGRFEVRRVRDMTTLTAARHNPACMRKLLITLNTTVRTHKPWDKSLHGA